MDAVRQNPTLVNMPVDALEKLFIARGYDSTDDYSASNVKEMELVTADAYLELATAPDIKEGALSLTQNRSILLHRARQIYLIYEDDKADIAGGRKLNLNITKR